MNQLKLFFQPHLTPWEKQLCKRFWHGSDMESYKDIPIKVHLLASEFKLTDVSEVFRILSCCYIYDTKQQCEICQRWRRIYYPCDLKDQLNLDHQWRCDECMLIIN